MRSTLLGRVETLEDFLLRLRNEKNVCENNNEEHKECCCDSCCENEEVIFPPTEEELAELEKYRNKDGVLDFVSVKNNKDLIRLMNVVERISAIKELVDAGIIDENHRLIVDNKEPEQSPYEKMAGHVGDIINEILPLMGLKNAELRVNCPDGSATVSVGVGKKPTIIYDFKKKQKEEQVCEEVCEDVKTCKTECCEPQDMICTEGGYCLKAEDLSISDDVLPCYEESVLPEDAVKVYYFGGERNEPHYRDMLYICEKYFPGKTVIPEYDVNRANTAVIIPNVWEKIYAYELETLSGLLTDGMELFVLSPNYHTMRPVKWLELQQMVMTPQQEASLD
jgi:hypothetical protein